MYKSIQYNPVFQQKKTTTLMGKSGMNQRDLSQLLDVKYANDIKNYLLLTDGGLIKRKGYENLFTITDIGAPTLFEKFNDDFFIFGAGTKIKYYQVSTATTGDIKTYGGSRTFSGQRYGDYFFVTTGSDYMSRIARTLAYDASTRAFTTGKKVTGGTSGATAIILEDNINYTPAYLTGGTAATAVVATWQAVTNGQFAITIDGTARTVLGLNFSAASDMDGVAAIIQTGIRAETKSTETCVWSTNKFIITSANTLSTSAVTVTSAVSGGTGTDISGVGATAFMDAETGRGTATAAVKLTTGTLVLSNISGTFQNDEILTDEVLGSATANGTVSWTATDVKTAPIASICKVIGNRLYLGRLQTDEAAIAYSGVDSGTNPPFTNWTVATLADSPGQVNFRNAGKVNAIEALGNNTIVFADKGKWAFYINTIDSAGTLSKVDVFTISRLDMGGARCAKSTPVGLLYANEAGLWRLVSVGQPNIPFSGQEEMISDLLGNTYFDDIDLDNSDITYHAKYNTVLLTCAKDSSTNNHIICWNTVNKAFSRFNGWNIGRFYNDNNSAFYGTSSSVTTVFTLFEGYQDGSSDIFTGYEQELNIGALETVKELMGGYMQGLLSPSTELTVGFDIWTKTGNKVADKLKLTWTTESGSGGFDGYGTAAWGVSAFGGDSDITGMVENLAGFRKKIANLTRIKIKFSGNDKVPHQINWVSLLTREKSMARIRNLTVSS